MLLITACPYYNRLYCVSAGAAVFRIIILFRAPSGSFAISRYALLRSMHAWTPSTTRVSPIARAPLTSSVVLGMRSVSSSLKMVSSNVVEGDSAFGLCFSSSWTSRSMSSKDWFAP